MIRNALFIIWLFATLFYLTLFDNDAMSNAFKGIVYASFVLLSVSAAIKAFRTNQKINKTIIAWFGCLLLSLLVFLVYHALCFPYHFYDIQEFAIPLLICFSTYELFNIEEDRYNTMIFWLVIAASLCSLYLVIRSGGFVIMDVYRDDVSKNQICPFLSQISLAAFWLATKENKAIKKIILYAGFVIATLPTIFFSARTALVCTIIGCFIIGYGRFKKTFFFYLIVLIVLVALFFGNKIWLTLYDSFVANRDVYDLESLSSGRVSRTQEAIQMINNNLFFGASANSRDSAFVFSDFYHVVHNYILLKLVRYGILGGIAFICTYFIVLRLCWIAYKKKDLLALSCLMLAIVTSLTEYCAPFGPGTAFVMCYMTVGLMLQPKKMHDSDKTTA